MSLQLSSVARSKFISGSFESKLNWESKDEKEMKHIEMTKRGIVLTKLKAKLLTALRKGLTYEIRDCAIITWRWGWGIGKLEGGIGENDNKRGVGGGCQI